MPAKIVAHPSAADRRAKGADAREQDPAGEPRRLGAGSGPIRSGGSAGGAEHRPASRIWYRCGTAG